MVLLALCKLYMSIYLPIFFLMSSLLDVTKVVLVMEYNKGGVLIHLEKSYRWFNAVIFTGAFP
jgi:hypothetical protein